MLRFDCGRAVQQLAQAELELFQQKQFKLLGKEVSDFIATRNIHRLGLKIWNGEGYTASKTIREIVKQHHPRLPIIAGGPHADYFMEYLLQSCSSPSCKSRTNLRSITEGHSLSQKCLGDSDLNDAFSCGVGSNQVRCGMN